MAHLWTTYQRSVDLPPGFAGFLRGTDIALKRWQCSQFARWSGADASLNEDLPMRTVSKIFMTLALVGVVALVTSAPSAAECTNTTTLVAGGSVRDICSDAAFTSGADSTVDGNISAKAGVTLGATSKVNGSVTAGAAFTSGDGSVVSGDVTSEGDITLGANSIITGSVHSKTGVINYGADAKVGKVIK